MPQLSRRTVLLAGFVIGLAIWLIPARFLGQAEPWDGNSPAYPLALFASGLLLGLVAPGKPGAAATGIFLGQLLVLVYRVVTSPENSELWLVGVVMLAGYTFVASGLGALLGGLVRRRLGPGQDPERRVSERRH
ncbi:MAG TPA: hypothetical protein VFH24_05950 [Gemmatimonadales bacterium]|nr:hypothetical protein [Gemmatimonadales bacterium]